eukprot:scaffold8152_cov113-Isochrysis_galbana.AAC.4
MINERTTTSMTTDVGTPARVGVEAAWSRGPGGAGNCGVEGAGSGQAGPRVTAWCNHEQYQPAEAMQSRSTAAFSSRKARAIAVGPAVATPPPPPPKPLPPSTFPSEASGSWSGRSSSSAARATAARTLASDASPCASAGARAPPSTISSSPRQSSRASRSARSPPPDRPRVTAAVGSATPSSLSLCRRFGGKGVPSASAKRKAPCWSAKTSCGLPRSTNP